MSHHILVVEDDDSLRNLYGIYLKRGNFNYTLVSFVDEALATLATQVIDLMMVDVNLNEDMSGLDLVQSIRADGKHPNLKIIVATSFPERFTDTQNMQVDKVLNKPIRYEDLLDAIKQALNRRD